MNPMIFLWVAAIIGLLILEASTGSLVALWFVGGALAALIAAFCGGSILLQCALFLIVSSVLLACLWPLRKKILNRGYQPTNADRVIGMTALVTEPIDNIRGTGTLKLDGKEWTVRSMDQTILPAGTLVKIDKLEGVKLYVTPVQTTAAV